MRQVLRLCREPVEHVRHCRVEPTGPEVELAGAKALMQALHGISKLTQLDALFERGTKLLDGGADHVVGMVGGAA